MSEERIELSRRLSKLRFTDDVVTLESFLKEEFHPSNIFGVISNGLENRAEKSPRKRAADPLENIDVLLDSCAHLQRRLEELKETVKVESDSLRSQLFADHAGYRSKIISTESHLKEMQISIEKIEKQSDHIIAFGRKVGEPMVELKERNQRALLLADILDHLSIFAHCTDPESLPSMFHDDDQLSRSADIVSALMSALDSITDPATEASEFGGQPVPGTLQAARDQLELYLNILDNKIVGKFDVAADSKDLSAMSYYAGIMDKAHCSSSSGSSILVARYIARNPIFLNPESFYSNMDLSVEEESTHRIHGMLDSPLHVEASRRISRACKFLSDEIRDEAAIMEQLFEDSEKAVSLFITRVFEDTLTNVVSIAFNSAKFDKERDLKTLRDSLRLVAEAYRKVLSLAEESCHLVKTPRGDGLSPIELAECAMGNILLQYVSKELSWHASLCNSTINAAKRKFSVEAIMKLISINEESVKRCVHILGALKRGEALQSLFCTPLDDGKAAAVSSSLLDFAGSYIISELDMAGEGFSRRLDVLLRLMESTSPGKTAAATVSQSLEELFGAISMASVSIDALKKHLKDVLEPLLSENQQVNAIAACSAAMLGLEKAVEHQISRILDYSKEILLNKILLILDMLQKKSDYSIQGSNTARIEEPTDACLGVCEIIAAIIDASKQYLLGNNYTSFINAVMRELERTIEIHLTNYTFSTGGALRLRTDLMEYSKYIQQTDVAGLQNAFDDLKSMSNILIVAPASVQEMVSSVSYIEKKRIKRLLERRSDYHSRIQEYNEYMQ